MFSKAMRDRLVRCSIISMTVDNEAWTEDLSMKRAENTAREIHDFSMKKLD